MPINSEQSQLPVLHFPRRLRPALREFYERKYGRAGAEKLWRCMQADHAVLQAKRLLENHMPLAVSAADRYRLLRRVRTAELRFWKLLQELAKRAA